MARANQTPLERTEQVIIVSALLMIVVVTVQPIIHLLALSLSDPAQVPGMSGLAITPKGFSLQVWDILFNHPSVRHGLMNSLLITGAGTALNITFTVLMAWALSRPRLPGRRMVFVLVLITIVFEPGIIPDYFVVKRLGLLNTYWAVILFKMVNSWYLIIMIRFFEDVPEELIEAAQLDGANAFQTLWSVVLPLARPAIATITLFYLVYHWNEFLRPMIYFNDQNMFPLQVVLRQFVVEGDKGAMVGLEAMGNYKAAGQISMRALKAGMILFTIAPVLMIYPLILKFFTKGTMSGAVK